MKVLFAHDHIFYKYKDLYYSNGGLSNVVLKRYTDLFEELSIISRQREINCIDSKLTLASSDRINFIKINDLNRVNSLNKIKDSKKIIYEQVLNTDFVIARLPSSIGNLAIKYARQLNKPYLVESVGCPWDSFSNYGIKGKLIAPFMYFKTKKYIKNSPYTIYVTNEFLQNRYPCKGKSIGCSDVSLDLFNDKILETRLEKINEKKDKLIIGTLAAVDVKYKGQQYVIEAISKINKQGYDIEYQIVGKGNQGYLQSVINKFNCQNNVKIVGPLPHKEVFKWLDEIDIYIQPSLQEGLPRSVIEAMSRACPISGSITGGIPELVSTNYLFKKKNINQICNVLKGFNKKNLKEEAIRSFYLSKEYENKLLEEKRTKFYKEFIDEFK